MGKESVLVETDRGLYIPAADAYIDPWKRVDRAIITHAHSDHARIGMGKYLTSEEGLAVLRARLGRDIRVEGLAYGQTVTVGGARISLHPAGHILGSCQVRVEVGGQVAVVSGDYKTSPDATTTAYEPVKCHLFVTESTFGLPVYRWPSQTQIQEEIHGWWRKNQQSGKCSVLMGYALGKAQRALAMLDPSNGPIFVHGAVHRMNLVYAETGIHLPPTRQVWDAERGFDWSRAIVVAPPSAAGTPWMRRFGETSDAFLSGWMAIRGTRRRRSVDRGFVLSDHVDWPSLLEAIDQTEAEAVWVTHGYSDVVSRYLNEQGRMARPLRTEWVGDAKDGKTGDDPVLESDDPEAVDLKGVKE